MHWPCMTSLFFPMVNGRAVDSVALEDLQAMTSFCKPTLSLGRSKKGHEILEHDDGQPRDYGIMRGSRPRSWLFIRQTNRASTSSQWVLPSAVTFQSCHSVWMSLHKRHTYRILGQLLLATFGLTLPSTILQTNMQWSCIKENICLFQVESKV